MNPTALQRALEKARTGRALAQALGRPEQQISNWKKGRDPIPAEAIAEMAVYLGEDPIRVLADEKGGPWQRVADAMRERISQGFDWLRLIAKPRRALILAR